MMPQYWFYEDFCYDQRQRLGLLHFGIFVTDSQSVDHTLTIYSRRLAACMVKRRYAARTNAAFQSTVEVQVFSRSFILHFIGDVLLYEY